MKGLDLDGGSEWGGAERWEKKEARVCDGLGMLVGKGEIGETMDVLSQPDH